MTETMPIDGQCHCGRVRYHAEIDPAAVSICHCTDCQSLTGTAFRVSVATTRANLQVTGEPKTYTKFGENGRRRFQHFCPDCGSPLFTNGEGDDAEPWGIRWGSIRQRAALVPRRQIWCRSRAPWIAAIDGLPGSSTDGSAGPDDGVRRADGT